MEVVYNLKTLGHNTIVITSGLICILFIKLVSCMNDSLPRFSVSASLNLLLRSYIMIDRN